MGSRSSSFSDAASLGTRSGVRVAIAYLVAKGLAQRGLALLAKGHS